jgi:hypothetical protein
MDPQKLPIFLADFDHQTDRIKKVYSVLEENASQDQDSRPLVESTGYWLHNRYCAYEDLFKITASFWENDVTSDSMWHKKLLDRMTLNIKGIRPALLSENSFAHLDELRGFRHVFRHAYTRGLDKERVVFLLKKVLEHKNTLLNDIKIFKKAVSQSANEI